MNHEKNCSSHLGYVCTCPGRRKEDVCPYCRKLKNYCTGDFAGCHERDRHNKNCHYECKGLCNAAMPFCVCDYQDDKVDGKRIFNEMLENRKNMNNGSTYHPHTCSPDKALMRVVEVMNEDWKQGDKLSGNYKDFIQTICPCGKVLSSNEIKE